LTLLGEAGQWIEVLRIGQFTDRNGKRVTIVGEDLDAYVTAFEENAAGQEIPVDIDHEFGEAAGWLRGMRRAGEVLEALPEWNELGRQLVGDRVYRYISATIDLAAKIIKSVSLVNFPAVKGLAPVELSEGVMLVGRRTVRLGDWLQARIHKAFTMIADDIAAAGFVTVEQRIELSGAIGSALEAFAANTGAAGEVEIEVPEPEFVFYMERFSREGGDAEAAEPERVEEEGARRAPVQKKMEGGTMTKEELAELREQIRQEELARLQDREAELAEERRRIRGELEVELRAQFERRQELTQFAEEITSGERGLSATAAEVVAALEDLDGEQLAGVQALLRSKVVEFGERGSGREGTAGRLELPAEYAARLASGDWTLADLANPVLELGELGRYDLSRWQK
jgi:hypothetical protein